MKTLEYVRKYNLSSPNHRFSHNEFVADLSIDFISLIEYMAINGEFTIDKFLICIDQIRKKWDSINLKTAGELPEKMWGYFYATTVVEMKNQRLPHIIEKEQEIRYMTISQLEDYLGLKFSMYSYGHAYKELNKLRDNSQSYMQKFAIDQLIRKMDKKRGYDERKEKEEFRKWQEQWFKERQRAQEQYDKFFNSLFGGLSLSVPTESFKILQLSDNATVEDIKKQYRALAITHHPDKGGSQEKFVQITEAKNRCLAYLKTS